MPQTSTAPSFADLLATVATEPGRLSTAFRAFHGYSLGNQLLALLQCLQRGITPGPIATFAGWKAKGRFVRKGEKAITLCMPVTVRRKATTDEDEDATFTTFVLRPHWFVISQTDGAACEAPAPGAWDRARALAALDVTEKAFDLLDGNVLGYAAGRTIAISPLAGFATTVHELAHIVLGHATAAAGAPTDRATREVEAEGVALLVLGTLEQPGLDEARGYIQHWLGQHPINERTAQRIFKAADTILRAGLDQAAAAVA
jgi:hypothetical protein